MNVFIELIRVALGVQKNLSQIPTEEEWLAANDEMIKQALWGICTYGMKLLPDEQQPPKKLYSNWVGITALLRQRNQQLNNMCLKIERKLAHKKFSTCVLKGQGVGLYYGKLAEFRQSGDIDVWLWPQNEDGVIDASVGRSERRRRILSFVRSINRNCKPVYHNVAVMIKNEVVVEFHFTPSWFYSPIHNARLQRWMESKTQEQFANIETLTTGERICAATLDFNRIHILLHIYRHLFGEGIGLRQVLDYYFVLRATDEYDKAEYMRIIRSFGAERFASALMWIMKTQFGLEDRFLLCETNETEGKFLFSEMITAGNFGHFDERIDRRHYNGFVGTFFRRMRRNLRFLSHYPSEVLWCPFWKVWHQLWLLTNIKNI